MTRRMLIVSVLILLWAAPARAETANRIIAVVNDDVITETDLTDRLREILEEVEVPEGTTPQQLQHEVLRRLIQQRLILQEAGKLGVTVGSDELAARIDEMAARAGSPEAFDELLRSQGLTREIVKDQVRQQMLIDRVISAKVKSTINVSPQEVAKELAEHPELAKAGDRVRADHILIRVDKDRTEEEAREQVDRVVQQLAAGGDFAALAKEYSEDSHARRGGAMGWVAQGELLPELDTVLFSLEPGRISEPVKTRLGFHLVRAVERKPASSLTIMEAHADVFRELFERKYQDALNQWLGGLAERAFVQILAPQQDS